MWSSVCEVVLFLGRRGSIEGVFESCKCVKEESVIESFEEQETRGSHVFLFKKMRESVYWCI